MTGDEARQRARSLFLSDDHAHGCAETTFVVLKEAFGLPDPGDPAAAFALNGGIAYRGGTCGAISGAALAVGLLSVRLAPDHATAKRAARRVVADLMAAFEAAHGASDCRALLGRSIRTDEEHAAFIASDVWRTVCMGQVEWVVGTLAPDAERRIRAAI
jgi:C_GCAxxG_C_C family probable redox protein